MQRLTFFLLGLTMAPNYAKLLMGTFNVDFVYNNVIFVYTIRGWLIVFLHFGVELQLWVIV